MAGFSLITIALLFCKYITKSGVSDKETTANKITQQVFAN